MKRALLIALLLFPAALAHTADEQPDLERQQAELQAAYDAYETGLEAAQQEDYATALREFRQAADDGLAVAQYNLGILYYTGRGVEQDYEQAAHWIRQAAEQGHTAAQYNLGVMYFNAQGVNEPWQKVWPITYFTGPSNFREAARWYERAARSGHTAAQYYLATMYRDGLGLPRDPVRAHVWARAADEGGYAGADALLRELEQAMTADQIRQARRLYAEQSLETQ